MYQSLVLVVEVSNEPRVFACEEAATSEAGLLVHRMGLVEVMGVEDVLKGGVKCVLGVGLPELHESK